MHCRVCSRFTCLPAAWLLFSAATLFAAPPRPNIVIVITDDQGYGDLGHTGNPVVQTPHIDALAASSTSLTDYHVAPTCSPTRAALMTGHWTDRTGVWHTINGRSMLRENEVTLAELLRRGGYTTGMFGKWHLGDNFPYRPEDRGFDEVYRHGGGGVGQTPDLWDNAYFDGSYFHNGRSVAAEGFCTDVFFTQARRFIQEQAAAGTPFFAYISLNAPHGPLHAPQAAMDRYADQPAALAAFYGMITNIDQNVGQTRQLLTQLGIADNTLFIFTTDNGTATGDKVFNAGMRGKKGSEYDGGHRVPFIAHWPAAGWNRRHASGRLCHAIDVVPTLMEIAGVEPPAGLSWDGVSIQRLLDPSADTSNWPERMLVTDSQRVRDPVKWKQTAVMSQRWRLVNGSELYDIRTDPGQTMNVAAEHPAEVAAMTDFYEAWWQELEPTFARTTEIYLGHPQHPEVRLTCHDWIGEDYSPWNQQMVRAADGRRRGGRVAGPVRHEAHWAVRVVTPGSYRFELRRWPVEADHPILASLPAGENVPGASPAFRTTPGRSLSVVRATLRIDGEDLETRSVGEAETAIGFTAVLAAGSHRLAPVFVLADGGEVGAYYCTVTLLAADQPMGQRQTAVRGQEIFSDSFERQDLGAWKAVIPGCSVKQGALVIRQERDDHGAVGRVSLPMQDLVMAFRFQLAGSPSFNVVFDDRSCKGSHAGHICRVSISPRQVRLGDDREGAMRNDIFAMRRSPDLKPLAERMILGRGCTVPIAVDPEAWHEVTIEIVGERMQVTVDGRPAGVLESPGIGHPTKTSVHFTVPGAGVLFDDVRIWQVDSR